MNRKKYEHKSSNDCVSDLELLNSIDYSSEAEYLKKVLNYLIDTINSIESRCERLRIDAQPFTYSPTMEERIELGEVRRRLINLSNTIVPLEKTMGNPYFCKIKINSNKKENTDIYVGDNDIIDNGNILVHSWASSVGRQYYANSNPKITIWGEEFNKELVRNIDIINSKINKIYDSFTNDVSDLNNIYDPYLQEILNRKKNVEGISNIISTIQNNQFSIISKDINENFIVQGCAGSGKTMIMLHRLSYLFYNVVNLSLDTDKIKIISPSKLFNEQITGLSKNINIENVSKYCLEDYYLEKIYKYNIKIHASLYKYNSKNKTSEVLYNYINTDLYGYIYSKEFEDTIVRTYNEYIDKLYSNFSDEQLYFACDYYELEKFTLSKKSLANFEIKIRQIKTKNDELLKKREKEKDRITLDLYDLNSKIKKLDLDIKKIDSELNVLSLISNISFKIKENQNSLKDIEAKYNKNNELINILNEILLLQYKINSLTFINFYKKNGYINKLKDLERNLNGKNVDLAEKINYNDLLNKLLDEKSSFETKINLYESEYAGYKSSIKEIVNENKIDVDFDPNSYMECLEQIEKKNSERSSFKNQVNAMFSKKETCTLTLKNIFILDNFNINAQELNEKLGELIYELDEYDIIAKKIYPLLRKELIKKFNLEKTDNIYKFDLYIVLYLCYLLKGPIISRDKYIFIDEGQDLSTFDYKLINYLNDKKIIFNIFGDVNQCIYESQGITDWTQLAFLNKFNLYSLNENYRNNINIVGFCTKEVGYEMMPIGLDSGILITFMDINKAISQLVNDKSKRKAIITKCVDDSLIEILRKSPLKSNFNIISSINQSIDNSKLNIIPINLVKGLEFDSSLIITKGMTQNEKYIALTRSLVNEYILY